MTYEEFRAAVEAECVCHEAHGKTVLPSARDESMVRRAFGLYGGSVHRAAFYLLSGRVGEMPPVPPAWVAKV